MIFGSAMFAIAFPRYLDQVVLFPAFPDELDAIGMGLIGSYMIIRALKPEIHSLAEKIESTVKLGLGATAMGIAISFPKNFGQDFALFPAFPNGLNSIGMGVISAYLFVDLVRDLYRKYPAYGEEFVAPLTGPYFKQC